MVRNIYSNIENLVLMTRSETEGKQNPLWG